MDRGVHLTQPVLDDAEELDVSGEGHVRVNAGAVGSGDGGFRGGGLCHLCVGLIESELLIALTSVLSDPACKLFHITFRNLSTTIKAVALESAVTSNVAIGK